MSKKSILTLFLSVFLILWSFCLHGQDDNQTLHVGQKIIVKMNNGEEFSGNIKSIDDETLVLETINGEMHLIVTKIKRIEHDEYKGKFTFANPHETRYFFGPSGFPIKKGTGYYQNVEVTTNFINYGLTRNISIGGGFEFISTIASLVPDNEMYPIWFLTPKIGFEINPKIHIGGGFIMAGLGTEGTATLSYGVFTYGNTETNASIGVGYGLFDGKFSDYPAVMLTGTHRVSNTIALISENYIIPNPDSNSSFPLFLGIQGVRILGRKNAFDIGAAIISEIFTDVPALPYVSYARTFGNRK